MVASRAMPKLLSITREKGKTAAARCTFGSTWTHLRQCLPLNKLRPSVPEEMFEGSREKGKPTDYSVKLVAYLAKTVCQETQCDTITNLTAEPVRLHCSHRDLNVSIHDGCSSVSVATNYLCFVSTYIVFLSSFFNVSINNIVVANAACSLGGGLYM